MFVLLVEAITSSKTIKLDSGFDIVVRDDINRHKADKAVNNKCINVFNRKTKTFEKIPQSQVRVGDIIQVYEGDIFPADLLFLRSDDPKSPNTCWINTKSLDGETDNKFRQAVKVSKMKWNELFLLIAYKWMCE